MAAREVKQTHMQAQTQGPTQGRTPQRAEKTSGVTAKTSASKVSQTGIAAILAAMGPGILTSFAGMDAGGIATFSTTGATFGFSMLWTIPVMTLLLIVVQETAARMGCATGKGFASLVRERFGIRVSALAMLALLVANLAVTISEFAGIASSMLLFDIPIYASVPVAAIGTWILTMSGSYKRIESILLIISSVFITYIVAGVLGKPDWSAALRATLIPQINNSPAYISLLVASVGTTISPYMIFMVSSNVVEKNLDERDIPAQRADNISGAVVAGIIAWFIILTTGAVLFPAGIQVNDASDAARALVPLAGSYASILFAAGLTGASFLAACVLPGITASAICEAFGWERGADRSWQEAPIYRGIITIITIVSAVIVIIPNVDLFGILMVAQIINGIALPVLLVCMVLIASDKHIMRNWCNKRIWNALTWFIIVAITVLTAVMFVLQALGV
ncbi:Nramp family divalent metal transporter [Atopobium deltae]|uniref:Metal ion transporter, metal ion transporter family n=1 Tax=Atopobium deltae TaxID=1393034 RepID=A0A133XWL9_9ACTN|nr:metal ion transporter, metal ion transporter family [Atopobium deltae]